MLTARPEPTWSSAKARRLAPSSSGVSPVVTMHGAGLARPERLHGDADRVPGAVLALLHREHHVRDERLDVRADLLPLVPDDRHHAGRLNGCDGGEDVADHASAGDRVQDLHRLRLHPGAAAGSEDDHGQVGHAAPGVGGVGVSSPGRSRTYVAIPDSKSGGPCRQTNRGLQRKATGSGTPSMSGRPTGDCIEKATGSGSPSMSGSPTGDCIEKATGSGSPSMSGRPTGDCTERLRLQEVTRSGASHPNERLKPTPP